MKQSTIFVAACLVFFSQTSQASFSIANIDQDGNPVITSKALGFANSSKKFEKILRRIARETGIKKSLLAAVIENESQWDPQAVSRAGALGLMQLMPSTAKEFGVENPFDPEENMRGGALYLRFLLNTFNEDLNLALAAYHQGHSRIKQLGVVPETGGTKDYIVRVMKSFGLYEMANARNLTASY